jgi:hypothetical protein
VVVPISIAFERRGAIVLVSVEVAVEGNMCVSWALISEMLRSTALKRASIAIR